jgi:hypothetical protein
VKNKGSPTNYSSDVVPNGEPTCADARGNGLRRQIENQFNEWSEPDLKLSATALLSARVAFSSQLSRPVDE